jgi:hypothetical protein
MSIWEDIDFAALDAEAQRLFFALLTHRSLSLAGVADWHPKRLAARYADGSETKVRKAAENLRAARYVYFDDQTDEIMIRTFVRHDKVLSKPTVVQGMIRDFGAISSPSLQRIFLWELHRLRHLEPDHEQWSKVVKLLEKGPVDPTVDPLVDPSVYPKTSGKPDPKTYEGSPYNRRQTADTQTADSKPQPASPNDDADAPSEAELFDIFWDAYDKKVGKKAAQQKFKAALKKPGVTAPMLTRAASEYVAWRKSEGKHPDYTKDASAWLNGEHWNDERAGRSGGPATSTGGLPHVDTLEQPPDDATDDELRVWYAEQQAKANGGRR